MKRVLYFSLIFISLGFPSCAGGVADTGAKILKERISFFSLTVTIRPIQLSSGPQRILLFTNSQTLPPPDAVGVPPHAMITLAEASKLIQVLESKGFFAQAGKFYAKRRHETMESPPPGAKDYASHRLVSKRPGYDIEASVFDDSWHTIYEDTFGTSVEQLKLFEALIATSDGEEKELLSNLMVQLK